MSSGNSYNGFVWAERQKAYDWLKREWAAGRRVKVGPECNVCGQTKGYLMAHSEDYSAPYGANVGRWSLCYFCHMMIHCRFKAMPTFERYVSVLEGGERFVNIYGPQWGVVQSYLAGRSEPVREKHGLLLINPFAALFEEGNEAREARELVSGRVRGGHR